MSLTGFNLRRRQIEKSKATETKPVISEVVAEETKKEEVKTEPKETKSATVVHKKTNKK